MYHKDLLIVGGGPAGLLTSIKLLEKGFSSDIVILEEHSRIGKPAHCAGVISLKGLKKYYLNYAVRESFVNIVNSARIYFPNGKELFVKADKDMAAIVDREKFDYLLSTYALEKGVDIRKGEKVSKIAKKGKDIKVLLNKEKKKYKVSNLILATGVNDRLSIELGFSKNKGVIPALQYEMAISKSLDNRIVEIFLGKKYSEGFFAWLIPLGDKLVKVGVASFHNPLLRMKYLLKESIMKEKLGSYNIRKVMGGAVITGGPKKTLLMNENRSSIFLIGDVAGQTKPTTGGGIVFIGNAAEILSSAIVNEDFQLYERQWWAEIKNEIYFQTALRKFLNMLTDNDLVKIYYLLKEGDFEEISAKLEEMDYQSIILKKYILSNVTHIFKHPLILAKAIIALVKSFF